MTLQPIGDADLPALLALNNAHSAELSLLDLERFRALVGMSLWAARIGAGDAFMLLLDQTADYDSPNYRWFHARYGRFAYVDRVAVAPAARGRGLARRLYAGAFAAASGHGRIMAEVNIEPPNPASDALHAALGFREVGRAVIHGGAKTVRYLERTLP
jgi:predicted GNAT superfamily acetyltransferase